jgi:hypothetical protein
MNLKTIEKLINKMMTVIKPNGVSKLYYKLKPIDDISQEYYMTVTYVIPNDSIILKSRNLIYQTRTNWNLEIVKTIKNYFDIDVIINSSGIQSESYFNRLKQ